MPASIKGADSRETEKQRSGKDLSFSSCFEVQFLLELEKAKLVVIHFHTKKRENIAVDFLKGVESTYQFSEKCTFFFSSSRNFPLPDSPNQIRWNRLFSFGKRLECCFILLAHFSAQSEKKVKYIAIIWRHILLHWNLEERERNPSNVTLSPKETNSNWWKGCITELQKGKIGVFLSLFTIIRVQQQFCTYGRYL